MFLKYDRVICTLITLTLASSAALAQPAVPADQYAVVWDSPGKNYKDSMPIGNGDLGMNLWTEANGDVVFLIDKTDAWTENGQLVKLGRVRLSFSPSPFTAGAAFKQILRPRTGEIEIDGANNTILRAWVDANAPVIHLEMAGDEPIALKASVELWRKEPRHLLASARELQNALREWEGIPGGSVTIDPDTVLPAKDGHLTWAHHNSRSMYALTFQNQHLEPLLAKYPDPLLNRTFGITMKGDGLASADNLTLQSGSPRKAFRVDLYALTNQSPRVEDWQSELDKIVAKTDAVGIEEARAAHQKWWDQFWNRSWIDISGDDNAQKVSQGYAMQRWMTACSARGPAPTKFNGGMFTVGQEPPEGTPYDPARGEPQNADYRAWGSNYWFQNQRLVYWPMIAAGDFDTLAPFLKMYRDALPLAKDRTALYYKHDGAIFQETIFFWGLPNNNDYGWGNAGPAMTNHYIRYHVNSNLELIDMMLDEFDITRDADFARNTLMPLATELTTYFDQHWKRVDGKILFEPSEAIETRQTATNPAPDIAGLMYVLPRLIALPAEFTTDSQRQMWTKLLADLPPLPRGKTDRTGKNPQLPQQAAADGKEILFDAQDFGRTGNSENPALYAVFPYRLFGVELPQIDLARATYDARRFKSSTCWGQDGIQAACLGWADRAKTEAVANFTAFGGERFKWFWKPGHDWEPDLDNGGAGQLILQNMLLQTRGDKILLLPAWPKEWNVNFKLHAPQNTTIECAFADGKIQKLTVTPPSRERDVVRMNER